MPHYIMASVNGIVRYDKDSDCEISGLGTSRLVTCVAAIIIGKKSGRISLSHHDFVTDSECLRTEAEWVGEPFEIVLVKNQDEIKKFLVKNPNLGKDTHTGNDEVEKNIIDFLRKQKLFKNLTKRIDSTTKEVYVDKSGKISIWPPKKSDVKFSPTLEQNDAISYVNGVYQAPRPAAIEFDGKAFLPTPSLLPAPLYILNMIELRINNKNLDITEVTIKESLEHVDTCLKELGSKKGVSMETHKCIKEFLNAIKVILDEKRLLPKLDLPDDIKMRM